MAIWLALLSAAIFGLVTVADKRLIAVNMPDLSSFYLIIVISLYGHTGLALAVFGIPATTFRSSLVGWISWVILGSRTLDDVHKL